MHNNEQQVGTDNNNKQAKAERKMKMNNTAVLTAPNGDTQTTIVMPTFKVVIQVKQDDSVNISWTIKGLRYPVLVATLTTHQFDGTKIQNPIWDMSATGRTYSDNFSRVADCFADAQQRTASWNG